MQKLLIKLVWFLENAKVRKLVQFLENAKVVANFALKVTLIGHWTTWFPKNIESLLIIMTLHQLHMEGSQEH